MKKQTGRYRTHSLDECKSDAQNYHTKTDWNKASPRLVSAARRHGWFAECTEHMRSATIGAPIKWTKELVIQNASNYANSTEWLENDGGAYAAAKRLGCLSDATRHFEPIGNSHKRLLYVIRVRNTKMVYVGITMNFPKRMGAHLKSIRFKHLMKRFGQNAIRPTRITNFVDAKLAIELEREVIQKYSARGFYLLNQRDGGALGATKALWDFDAVANDAKKYKYVGDWSLKSHAAYTAALHNNWLKILVKQGVIARKFKPKGYWTPKKIIETALQVSSNREWRRKHRVAYDKAVELGINKLDFVTAHFKHPWKYKDNPKNIEKEVSKYASLKQLREQNAGLYSYLKQSQTLEIHAGHLKRLARKPWTAAEIFAEAKKYGRRTDFQLGSGGAYGAARRLDCLDAACAHMTEKSTK